MSWQVNLYDARYERLGRPDSGGNTSTSNHEFFVIVREATRLRDKKRPLVRAAATDQKGRAGSAEYIAMRSSSLKATVMLINLGNYPVHVEAAMWWSDRMRDEEQVEPRTELLGLTIPSGANALAALNMTLTISEWGWVRFYFSTGVTDNKYPYIEVPMGLHEWADEGTAGYDEDIVSTVLFYFERQKQDKSNQPWHEVRHTFNHGELYLTDDQSEKHERLR